MRPLLLAVTICLVAGIVSAQASHGYPVPTRVRVREESARKMVIKRVEPVRPGDSKISGAVKLKALVGKDGSVKNLKAFSGSPMLIPAAIDAVRQWQFEIYYLDGKPVEFETTITVDVGPRQRGV